MKTTSYTDFHVCDAGLFTQEASKREFKEAEQYLIGPYHYNVKAIIFQFLINTCYIHVGIKTSNPDILTVK